MCMAALARSQREQDTKYPRPFVMSYDSSSDLLTSTMPYHALRLSLPFWTSIPRSYSAFLTRTKSRARDE